MVQLNKEINSWIFDLDNTLYPADSGIFHQVHVLMGKFISKYLNIEINKWGISELNSHDCRFVFKRECMSDVGIFLQKKRSVRHKLFFGQSQKCRFEKSNNPGNRCLKK